MFVREKVSSSDNGEECNKILVQRIVQIYASFEEEEQIIAKFMSCLLSTIDLAPFQTHANAVSLSRVLSESEEQATPPRYVSSRRLPLASSASFPARGSRGVRSIGTREGE